MLGDRLVARERRWERRRVLRVLAGSLAVAPELLRSEETRGFDLRIEKGRVVGDRNVVRITEGQRVELRWRSDAPVELHLHGYDLTVAVSPEAPAFMRFEANATGRFPVTRHAEDGHGHATLIYLEVYPR